MRAPSIAHHVQNREYLAEKSAPPKNPTSTCMQVTKTAQKELNWMQQKGIAYLFACSTCIELKQCRVFGQALFILSNFPFKIEIKHLTHLKCCRNTTTN